MNTDEHRLVEGGEGGAHAGGAVRLSEDSRSVAAWDLAAPHRGGLVAAGVGGAITGLGANLMVVDDPVKNREEAESEPARRRLWEWWTSTAYTRLEDGAAVVGMLTRWHTDDWAGKLLKQVEEEARADRWEVVVLPAIWEGEEVQFHTKDTKGTQRDTKVLEGGEAEITAETQRGAESAEFLEGEEAEIASLEGRQLAMTKGRDVLGRGVGEALWPEKYGVEDLQRIRANVGEYDWEALYQQRPYSRSMGFFRREWFSIVEKGPEAEEIVGRVRAWDKAGTAKGSGGDYAVGVLLAMTRGGVVYVEDVVRGQFRPLEREEAIERAALLDLVRVGPATLIWHQQDPGSAGLDSAEATSRRLARHGFRAQFETVTGSKEVRAGPWSTMCQGGGVRLVRGGWNEAFIAEHEAFPRGRFDDQVDASSWGFGKLGTGTMEGKLFF
jgi:predicted phage terminase large subunit-like protein